MQELKNVPQGVTAFAPDTIQGYPSDATSFSQYSFQFGDLPPQTVYLDLNTADTLDRPEGQGIDRRDEIKAHCMEEIKALTTQSPLLAVGTNYSATSGRIPVLLPTIVDSTLYDITKRKTPLASGLIPRVTNRGIYADTVRMTALPTAVWKPEDSSLPDTTATYDRVVAQIRYAFAVGRVTGPMIVASPEHFKNMLRQEQVAAFRALKELEENTIINGDTTSATYTNGFNGFVSLIASNTEDKSGDQILLSDIDTAFITIEEAKGTPTLIVTDTKTFTDLKVLMRDILIGTTGQATLDFGFRGIKYEGVPIVPDLFMPTAGDARELHVLDTSSTANGPNIQIRVLQDATMEELAKNNDSFKFAIKEYITMIIIQEAWCYRIHGLD